MGHVFISYAREDRQIVSGLRAALEQHGFSVWVDDRLVAGAHYDVAIEEALAVADRVIVAWSPAASASQWVRAEAGEGLERGVLVPVLVEPTKVPLEFRRIQTVDLTDWDGQSDNPAFRELVTALEGAKHSPARSRTPVVEGERTSRQRSGPSAEVLSASKYFFNFRIRLRLSGRSISIRHANRLLYQVVKLDGRVVSSSPFGWLHDHYRFPIAGPDGEHSAELFVVGDGMSLLKGISLDLDGREVLRHRVGWTDGLLGFVYGAMLFGFLGFGTGWLTAQLNDLL